MDKVDPTADTIADTRALAQQISIHPLIRILASSGVIATWVGIGIGIGIGNGIADGMAAHSGHCCCCCCCG